MPRKHDRELASDTGQTTAQLLAAGYVQESDVRMRNGLSVKHQCSGCGR